MILERLTPALESAMQSYATRASEGAQPEKPRLYLLLLQLGVLKRGVDEVLTLLREEYVSGAEHVHPLAIVAPSLPEVGRARGSLAGRILSLLEASGTTGLRYVVIATTVGASPKVVHNALTILVAKKLVHRTRPGTYARAAAPSSKGTAPARPSTDRTAVARAPLAARIQGEERSGACRDNKESMTARALSFLRKHGTEATALEVTLAIGGRKDSTATLMCRLVKEGRVLRKAPGLYVAAEPARGPGR